MDAMTFLGFMVIVLVGGVTFALIMQFLDREPPSAEAHRTRRVEVEPAVQSVAALPAFFAKLHSDQRPPTVFGFDDALVAFLEDHVKAEQAMAAKFVHFPSVDSLYRQARPSPRLH